MGTSQQTNTTPSGDKQKDILLKAACNVKASKNADGTWNVPLLSTACLEELLGKTSADNFGSTDFFTGGDDEKAVVAYYQEHIDPTANPDNVSGFFSDILYNTGNGQHPLSWFKPSNWVPSSTTGFGQIGPDGTDFLENATNAFGFLTNAQTWLYIAAGLGGLLLIVVGGRKAMDG